MGSVLTDKLAGLKGSSISGEYEWNRFYETQSTVARQIKELDGLLKKIRKETDGKKREALRMKIHNNIVSYNKKGEARRKRWSDFVDEVGTFQKAIKDLSDHIVLREKRSLFRNKQHTLDAKKVLKTAEERLKLFKDYSDKNFIQIDAYRSKYAKY